MTNYEKLLECLREHGHTELVEHLTPESVTDLIDIAETIASDGECDTFYPDTEYVFTEES